MTLFPFTRKLSGDGPFCKNTQKWLQDHFHAPLVILTPSCTAALEMGLLLMDLAPGDEVIVPSYTFSSTASAIVMHGGVPVFVESDPQTLNICPHALDAALTPQTKGIIPMHYGGVGCNMEKIQEIAKREKLFILEDAAQCMGALYAGKKLGTFGQVSAFSFHDTKNISCGEGGCLVVNDLSLVERAEIIRDKGTNRSLFFRGQVDKYRWMDKGSSYLMSDLQAEFLLSQLTILDSITQNRLETWSFYHQRLGSLEEDGVLKRMQVPLAAQHNAHLYYILLPTEAQTDLLRGFLNDHGILAVSHYVPLHLSPAGIKYGRLGGEIKIATNLSNRLLRLPLFYQMTSDQKEQVCSFIEQFFKKS